MTAAGERTLAEVFVDLSDTLVADYDVVDFLHLLTRRCVDLLGVRAAGIMVGDQRGGLRVIASSSEQATVLELLEAETEEGPCVVCFAAGRPVTDPNLGAPPDPRWPRFADRAGAAGFRAVHAIPVRWRDEVIGVLNLFDDAAGQQDETTARAARALANLTTVGLLQHRAVEYRQVLAEQLQQAMNSRVVIEQAKGILAEHFGLDMAAAFDELRRFAGRVGRGLSEVAVAVAAGDFGSARIGERGLRILLIRRFGLGSVAELRAEAGNAAARHGLSNQDAELFVFAVHEAAVNAIRHGGGSGQVLLWRQGSDLIAEISDQGLGFPPGQLIETSDPGADTAGGRGLWLIGRVSAGLEVETGGTGTRLTLRFPLEPRAAGPQPA